MTLKGHLNSERAENLMSFKSKLVSWMDSNAPSVIGSARYRYHVSLRGDIVYPLVSPKLFERLDARHTTAIDVGANVGIYTRYLCKYFSSVISVEPIPYLADRLVKSRIGNCRVEEAALGSAVGTVTMRIPINAAGSEMPALSTASESNSLSFIGSSGVVERQVSCLRLDDVAESASEGFEGAVLSGAGGLLKKSRPVIQIEIGRAHNPNYRDILTLLDDAKFTGFAMQKDGLYTDIDHFLDAQPMSVSQQEESSPSGCWDYLFIPNERVAALSDGLVRR
jgi:FkbM family methyltransferase